MDCEDSFSEGRKAFDRAINGPSEFNKNEFDINPELLEYDKINDKKSWNDEEMLEAFGPGRAQEELNSHIQSSFFEFDPKAEAEPTPLPAKRRGRKKKEKEYVDAAQYDDSERVTHVKPKEQKKKSIMF